MGTRNGLNPDFLELLFNDIHKESLSIQKQFIEKQNADNPKKEPNFAR
jgi:chorismate mutase